MIDQEFLQEARQALLREREITKEQISKCEEEERNIKQGIRSRDIEMGDDFNMLAPLEHNHWSLTEKLQDIESALRQIENDTYGICICGCGQEIDKGRLRRGEYYVKRRTPCQQEWEKTHSRRYW